MKIKTLLVASLVLLPYTTAFAKEAAKKPVAKKPFDPGYKCRLVQTGTANLSKGGNLPVQTEEEIGTFPIFVRDDSAPTADIPKASIIKGHEYSAEWIINPDELVAGTQFFSVMVDNKTIFQTQFKRTPNKDSYEFYVEKGLTIKCDPKAY